MSSDIYGLFWTLTLVGLMIALYVKADNDNNNPF